MVTATIDDINAEMTKFATLVEGVADAEILENSHVDKFKVISNELHIIDENVFMYLTFNSNIKRIKCVFYLTDIDEDYIESLITKVGLPATDQNIQNYKRDPTLVAKYWNDRFLKTFKEILKKLRKLKIKYQFQERFPPTYNKNRDNEIVDCA